jgi:hypothetical protein
MAQPHTQRMMARRGQATCRTAHTARFVFHTVCLFLPWSMQSPPANSRPSATVAPRNLRLVACRILPSARPLRQHARRQKHTKARARIMKSAVERQNDDRISATNRIPPSPSTAKSMATVSATSQFKIYRVSSLNDRSCLPTLTVIDSHVLIRQRSCGYPANQEPLHLNSGSWLRSRTEYFSSGAERDGSTVVSHLNFADFPEVKTILFRRTWISYPKIYHDASLQPK